MQNIPIPNAILLRLARRLTSIFSESDLTLDGDVQFLFGALMAAAKLATMEDEEDLLSTPTPLSPICIPWDSSSTAVDHSQSSSPRTLNGDLPYFDLDDNLPPSSPPLPPSDFDIPPSELDDGEDEMIEEMAPVYHARGVKRTRLELEESDARANVTDERARRAARRAAAQARDEARLGAIQVMGHNWTPDCHRAGDRVPGAGEVIARELVGGIPMIDGPDGPEPDPSISDDNPYVPGVGFGSETGEIRGEMADDVDVLDETLDETLDGTKGKGKGKRKSKAVAAKGDWKKAVRTSRLKLDAAPLMSLLTDISTTSREADLWADMNALCNSAQPVPLASSSSPITQILHEIEDIKKDTCALNFYSMLKVMQLVILVDLCVSLHLSFNITLTFL